MKPSRDARRARDQAGSSLLGHRARVALLVATIFGMPLCLMLVYVLTSGAGLSPPFADQPGGEIHGRVVDPEGAPVAGHPVRVLLRSRDREARPHAEVRTGPDGAFAARVPALEDGCYAVRAGGGPWVETGRDVSLAGGDRDVELRLRPAAELVLHVRRADGSSVGGGRYFLRRRRELLGLPMTSVTASGSFEGGTLRRGGLEPGKWRLSLELPDGTAASYELDLPVGTTERTLPYF